MTHNRIYTMNSFVKKNRVVFAFAAAVFSVMSIAEASVGVSRGGGLITVQNNDVPFDKGNFDIGGKSITLEVPENASAGLVRGSKILIKSIDFGATPAMYNVNPADRIVLERSADGGKWTSASGVADLQNPIVSAVGGSVPRLSYSFDALETSVGERFVVTLVDGNGSPMKKVRYAACEVKDGNNIFGGFSFTSPLFKKDYAPVYAIRFAAVPVAPPKPPVVRDEPPARAKRDSAKPSQPEAEKPPAVAAKKTNTNAERKESAEKRLQPKSRETKDYPLSMSIDRPKKEEVCVQDNNRSFRGYSYNRDVEVKSSTYSYKGKLSCTVPRDEKAEIAVEAYFVVRDIAKGAKDRIDGSVEVGRFAFGDDNPPTRVIEFTSPTIDETKVRRSYGSVNQSDSAGSRYVGVIVRALQNGKVRKVVTIPSNSKWVKAAGKDVLSLDDGRRSERKYQGDGGDNEPRVHTRIDGTGQSTPPGWLDDFYKAQEIAKKDGKWMLVVFCGSDWCGPCRALTDRVLRTVRFQDALKGQYVLVFVDSPRDESLLSDVCRKQNKEVARALKGSGVVPDVNVFDAEGRRLVNLGGAVHLENGVSSYLKFFLSVDKGLRILSETDKKFASAGKTSPEYIKARHEALQNIDEETLIDHFVDEAEQLIAADRSYLKFYPYVEFVMPLEKRLSELDDDLSRKVFYAMQRDSVPFGNSSERKKYRRKFFDDGGYSRKYNELLDAVKSNEGKVGQTAVLNRLRALKLRILRSTNDD